MTATCDAAGELTNRTLENGVSTGYAYDVAGQLTGMAQTLNNVAFDTLGYTLNNRGRRTGITRANGKNDGYSYDAIGEVVGGAYTATATGNQTEAFAYDAAGNRLTSARNGANTAYTANANDQYTTVGGAAQNYDANGNNTLASIPGAASSIAMQWDSENRLLSTQSTTAKSDHGYDALHRRVWKKVYATDGNGGWTLAKTVVFTYDGWNVIAEKEYPGSASIPAGNFRYTWGADVSGSLQGAGGVGGLLMTEEINGATATPHYYCYDGNGNVTHIVDAAGNLEASHRYNAFGGNLDSLTTTAFAQRNPWRFSTKYLDREVETTEGLYYYGYRYYLTALGRWPSEDPIRESGGLNLYGYVGNRPIGAWDPLGLDWKDYLPHSLGISGSVDVTNSVNPAVFSAHGEASGGFGIFTGENKSKLYSGAYASHGESFGPLGNLSPQNTASGDINPSFGAYAGLGTGGWFSNAKTACDLEKTTKTAAFNIGFGLDFGIAFSFGNGIWHMNIVPPSPYSAGLGVSASLQRTTTYSANLASGSKK